MSIWKDTKDAHKGDFKDSKLGDILGILSHSLTGSICIFVGIIVIIMPLIQNPLPSFFLHLLIIIYPT
ncbi:hypothetical protein L1987_22147 [Smallanthus sonchifolius]|uniref:Uncharacterized protein n=1 Tax=Smallanthus sonchifolius TaxID=185202 RepID=A0ACB9IEZ9_9ASTR|nr:hypothetical protein L1987_22147 [Smallanthus sonchifolius]